MNVCVPSDYEFQILKPFYLFKLTNKMGWQSLWGFPGLEITWMQKKTFRDRGVKRTVKILSFVSNNSEKFWIRLQNVH